MTIFKLYLWKIANTICFNIKLPWCERKTFTVHPNAKPSALLNTMHSCIEKVHLEIRFFKIQVNLLKNKFQCSIIQLNITQINEVSVLCKHKAKRLIYYTHELFCIEYWMVNGNFYYTRTHFWLKLSLKRKREIINWLAQRWTIRIHIFMCFFCWI